MYQFLATFPILYIKIKTSKCKSKQTKKPIADIISEFFNKVGAANPHLCSQILLFIWTLHGIQTVDLRLYCS